MTPLIEGFTETPHRPWPDDNPKFVVVNIHPKWLDLCFVRTPDKAIVYLATKPNPEYNVLAGH